jgi:hypothetical protein
LRSIVQVRIELFLRESGFLGKRVVIALAVLVQGDDEVVDGL